MNKLTKKYIFECKLKGKPIILTGYSHKDWQEIINFLCECNIVQRANKAVLDKDIRYYSINYHLIINNIGQRDIVTTGFCVFSNKYTLNLHGCRGMPEDD